MTSLDTIPQDEINRAVAGIVAECNARVERDVVDVLLADSLSKVYDLIMPEPSLVYVPENRSAWFEPYYAGAVVMPSTFSGLIQCVDGAPDLRGHRAERARFVDKMVQAERAYQCAVSRRNARRQRYWSRQVERWLRCYNARFA